MIPGRVGAVAAAVRSSRRRSELGLARIEACRAARTSRPRSTLVEDATVHVVEYQHPGAAPRHPPEFRKLTLPRCFRKGKEELYAARLAKVQEQASAEAKMAVFLQEHGLDHLVDQKSEASASTAETATAKLPEPFAKFLSQKLGVQVTSVFYPDESGKYREFQPEFGSLPFVDGITLIVCVDGEEQAPDFVWPTALPTGSTSTGGCCGLMQLLRRR